MKKNTLLLSILFSSSIMVSPLMAADELNTQTQTQDRVQTQTQDNRMLQNGSGRMGPSAPSAQGQPKRIQNQYQHNRQMQHNYQKNEGGFKGNGNRSYGSGMNGNSNGGSNRGSTGGNRSGGKR